MYKNNREREHLLQALEIGFPETPTFQRNPSEFIIGLLSSTNALGGDCIAELEAQDGHERINKNLVYRTKTELETD